jgi:hypothetical protein
MKKRGELIIMDTTGMVKQGKYWWPSAGEWEYNKLKSKKKIDN